MQHVRRSTLTIVMALLASATAEAAERHLAVVVGVNTYRANSGLPKLQHAASDASVLSITLRNAGFKVYEMTHDVARQDGQETMAPQLAYIRDQIRGILETPNLGENDAVLITLHGHGVQFDFVDEKGNKTPRFYFCPADATVDGVKTANDITDRDPAAVVQKPAPTEVNSVAAIANRPSPPGFIPVVPGVCTTTELCKF
ncbi:MAG: caspase family protein [Planctomycetota bacterium]